MNRILDSRTTPTLRRRPQRALGRDGGWYGPVRVTPVRPNVAGRRCPTDTSQEPNVSLARVWATQNVRPPRVMLTALSAVRRRGFYGSGTPLTRRRCSNHSCWNAASAAAASGLFIRCFAGTGLTDRALGGVEPNLRVGAITERLLEEPPQRQGATVERSICHADSSASTPSSRVG